MHIVEKIDYITLNIIYRSLKFSSIKMSLFNSFMYTVDVCTHILFIKLTKIISFIDIVNMQLVGISE